MKEKYITFLLILVIIITLIGYIILMYETYKKKTFIFTPYVLPKPDGIAFQPLGPVSEKTPEQMQNNKVNTIKSLNN